MDKEKLRERLLGIFISEVEVHVAALRQGLAALELGSGACNQQQFESLRRAAHTLKGAARSAGVPLLQTAGYAMERIFRAAEERKQTIDSDLTRLLLEATEGIDEVRRRLCDQEEIGGTPLESLLTRLEESASRCASRS